MTKLKIVVIGDTFAERYIWGRTPDPNESGVHEMPYLEPVELRAKSFTETHIEVSGTPLHHEIYKDFLEQFEFKVDLESVPNGKGIAEALAMSAHPRLWNLDKDPATGKSIDIKLSGNQIRAELVEAMTSASFPLDGSRSPFPVFLHELRPFPKQNRKGDSSVWRIAQTFGEVRDGRQPAGADDHVISSIQTWMEENIPKVEMPTVFVICDRNTRKGKDQKGIRTGMTKEFLERLRAATRETGESLTKNALVIWHTRFPFHKDNAIAEFLTGTDFHSDNVIPIINAQCVREAGVHLRFDVSFETTLRQVIEARTHEAIRFLLKFRHSLIRFDYGVIHLTAKGGEISGIDIHAFNSGPQTRLPFTHGMMAGMTPLMVCALLREIAQFVEHWAGPDKDDGAPNEFRLADFVASDCLGNNGFKHPTLQNTTPIDRAIDLGLILGQLHMLMGYGNSKDPPFPGNEPRSDEKVSNATNSGDLYRQLTTTIKAIAPSLICEQTRRTADSKEAPCPLRFQSEQTNLIEAVGGLTRISMDEECFAGFGVHRQNRTRRFSRVSLLSNNKYMDDIAGVPLRSYYEKNDELRKHLPRHFDRIAMRIVSHGLDHVFARDYQPGYGVERHEPSIAVPYVAFGNYRTADLEEIDEFLELRFLVEKYVAEKNWTTPLAIAVFGRPGSGKSTIVREILSAVDGCRLERSLETNVSQWTDLRSLTRQLHRIRDFTLEEREAGNVPAAFFDEFDARCDEKEVGWLRYFLMPLQDGLYMDGEDKFHIGKSIFVFAGGVSHTYEDFKATFGKKADDKVPDFMGRLRTHINVAGIDLPTSRNKIDACRVKLRRAVFLRSILSRGMKQIFDHKGVAAIAPNIVMAMLNAPRFEHGVRSMEAIVQMSRVPKGAHSFQPSALPPESQLEPHVNAAKFMEYLKG